MDIAQVHARGADGSEGRNPYYFGVDEENQPSPIPGCNHLLNHA